MLGQSPGEVRSSGVTKPGRMRAEEEDFGEAIDQHLEDSRRFPI